MAHDSSNDSCDGQIILDFTENFGKRLKTKWDKNHPDKQCYLIPHRDAMDKFLKNKLRISDFFNNQDQFIKICIVAHGAPKINNLWMGSSNPRLPIDKLAEHLTHFLQDRPTVINLVACGGGRGSRSKSDPAACLHKSIASKLHAALFNNTKQDIPIVARTQITRIGADYKAITDVNLPWKKTHLFSKYYRKQPCSKIIFRKEKADQVIEDAYALNKDKNLLKWKTRVLKIVENAEKKTKNKKKKKLLLTKLHEWGSLSPEEIFQKNRQIKNILKKNSHSTLCGFLYGFFFQAQTVTSKDNINQLIENGNRLFNRLYAKNAPHIEKRKTGVKFYVEDPGNEDGPHYARNPGS